MDDSLNSHQHHSNEDQSSQINQIMSHVPLTPELYAEIMKMQSNSQFDKKGGTRQKFIQDEDEKLRELVKQYGVTDWKAIAGLMPNRTPRQCRERWKNYLSPDVTNTPWTEEEDKLLEDKYRELGKQWSKIAKFFPGRTDINIKNRWVSRGSKRFNLNNDNEKGEQGLDNLHELNPSENH